MFDLRYFRKRAKNLAQLPQSASPFNRGPSMDPGYCVYPVHDGIIDFHQCNRKPKERVGRFGFCRQHASMIRKTEAGRRGDKGKGWKGMRTILTFILVAGVAGAGDPPKPWKPEMCGERQEPLVSEAYIRYCIKAYHFPNLPVCPIVGPGPKAFDKPIYFEVLDCSWRVGENPRMEPPWPEGRKPCTVDIIKLADGLADLRKTYPRGMTTVTTLTPSLEYALLDLLARTIKCNGVAMP